MPLRTVEVTEIKAGTHFSNGDGEFVASTDATADHHDRQLVAFVVRIVIGDQLSGPVAYSADSKQVVEILPA